MDVREEQGDGSNENIHDGDAGDFILDDFLTSANYNPIDSQDADDEDEPMTDAVPRTNAGEFAHKILHRSNSDLQFSSMPCAVQSGRDALHTLQPPHNRHTGAKEFCPTDCVYYPGSLNPTSLHHGVMFSQTFLVVGDA